MDSNMKALIQDMIDRSIRKHIANRRSNISATMTSPREAANRADADQAGESREVEFAFPPGIKAMPMTGDRLQIPLNHDQGTTTPGVDVSTGVQYENEAGEEQYEDVGDSVRKPLPAVKEGELVMCAPAAPAESKLYCDANGNIWLTAKIGAVKNRNYFPGAPVSISGQNGCLFLSADLEVHIDAPNVFVNAQTKATVTSPLTILETADLRLGSEVLTADDAIVRKSDLSYALTHHTHPDAQGGETGVGTDTSQGSAIARCG